MAKVNLARNIETISWSDEPGAKEYVIDFSDGGLQRMYEALQELKKHIEVTEHNPENMAEVVKDFIVTTAGQECYDDALAYVDAGGFGATESSVAMMSLVTALADVITENVGKAKSAHVKRYLRKGKKQLI